MNKLFDKRELLFSVCVIAVYSVQYTLAEKLSEHLGITSSVTATLNLGLSFALVMWIHRENLYEYYGLCKAKENGKKVLLYIPLLIISTRNFWHGFALNLPVIDTVFYIANMLTVGFLEELLFRGLLFKAIEKRSVKSAFIISSLTFGLGHIVHLFDGSGMTLVASFCQVLGAFGVGFVFAAVFYSAGSLIPCIVTHSLYDAFSAFANEADRGHFVMEQLLYGKYAISVTTYENYGGRDAAKILNKLLSYSGAKICGAIVVKNKFNKNPMGNVRVKKKVGKTTTSFYRNIVKGRRYRIQGLIHSIIFRVGIQPFVKRKGVEYEGVIKHWKNHNIVS